jgi:hypothetical protein
VFDGGRMLTLFDRFVINSIEGWPWETTSYHATPKKSHYRHYGPRILSKQGSCKKDRAKRMPVISGTSFFLIELKHMMNWYLS